MKRITDVNELVKGKLYKIKYVKTYRVPHVSTKYIGVYGGYQPPELNDYYNYPEDEMDEALTAMMEYDNSLTNFFYILKEGNMREDGMKWNYCEPFKANKRAITQKKLNKAKKLWFNPDNLDGNEHDTVMMMEVYEHNQGENSRYERLINETLSTSLLPQRANEDLTRYTRQFLKGGLNTKKRNKSKRK